VIDLRSDTYRWRAEAKAVAPATAGDHVSCVWPRFHRAPARAKLTPPGARMRLAISAIIPVSLAACASVDTQYDADCSHCPEMVAVASGAFIMGAPADEDGRFEEEGPQHTVRIAGFYASRTPVTRAQYAAFVAMTDRKDPAACNTMSDAGEWHGTPGLNWRAPGFEQSDTHPVVCVSWEDAQAYVRWLSNRTGETYRLLTEAEFEYAARAGSQTTFPWGAEPGDVCARANGFDLAAKRGHPDWPSLACDDGYAYTSPVAHFPANRFGLHDMTGNVFQWVEDCFTDSYAGAPVDGTAQAVTACQARVIRGGSWLNGPRGLRAAMRDRDRQQDRYTNVGFRVARSATSPTLNSRATS